MCLELAKTFSVDKAVMTPLVPPLVEIYLQTPVSRGHPY